MLKKIGIDQVRTGMFVTELCGSWMEHPFWNTRFLLEDEADLRRLVDSRIRELWIDVSRGADVDTVAEGALDREAAAARAESSLMLATQTRQPRISRVCAAEELSRAKRLCEAAKPAVANMFREARMGQSVDTAGLHSLVEDISSSVMRHPGAFVSLARLKNKDDYTYMHSVAVCGLMVALARRLGLDDHTTREAGLAGLLHDLGKAAIPLDVLNKPGKLSDDEFRIVKDHPTAGFEMLREAGGVGEIALDVALHHHEKVDGTGYPHRLKSEEISLFAKMGAVCDVYDAITSDRPYKAGWNPSEALRKMAEWAPGHFETSIFHAFVKTVGIYPLGSLVRLESGLLAVVVETRDDSLLKPVVKAFYCTRRRQRISPRLLDLGRQGGKDAIAGWESRDQWRFPDLDELWVDGSLAASA